MSEVDNSRPNGPWSTGEPWSSGIVLGLAFGAAWATLALFGIRQEGGLALFVEWVSLAPLVIGLFVGVILARVGLIGFIRPVPRIALALVIASAPFLAGSIEVRMRADPVPIPADARAVHWTNHAWGDRILTFESPQTVPALYARLVGIAKAAGWSCRNCSYVPSAGRQYASFEVPDATDGGAPGSLGFWVWQGEGFRESAPSGLTKVRLYHDLRTESPRCAGLGLTILLLLALLFRLYRKLVRNKPIEAAGDSGPPPPARKL